jgi:predicted GNAT superfamily acetyltransferase
MHHPAIEIRALQTDDDLRQCVALQRATWGADYDDIVPPSVLNVAQKIGGVAAGAFDERNRMIGFVFGMAGVRDGRVIHWSDMLAVREDARDHGVGQRLKEFQRAAAASTGASTMYWTYDPLVARNAHMNFNKLGVTVDEYVEDMYGASESDLHRGLGTDRFIVAWPLREDASSPRQSHAHTSTVADSTVLNPGARIPTGSELASFAAARPPLLRVEIPLDIVRVRDHSPSEAAQWRASTRQAFQWLLAHRYTVRSFAPDDSSQRGHYLLTRDNGVST